MTLKNDKAQTRRRLIDEALKLSATKGFSTLSLREVSQAAGITPTAFYRHFAQMEDLGLVLLDEVGVSLRQLLRDSRKQLGEVNSVTESSINVFLDYVTENANLFRLLLGERQGASTAFRKAIHNEIDRFVSDLTEDLEKGSALRKEPISKKLAPYAAEAIVAVVFTVGAEALDLPKHKRENLKLRLTEEVKMILRGATK